MFGVGEVVDDEPARAEVVDDEPRNKPRDVPAVGVLDKVLDEPRDVPFGDTRSTHGHPIAMIWSTKTC
jgi:hypothetical protein